MSETTNQKVQLETLIRDRAIRKSMTCEDRSTLTTSELSNLRIKCYRLEGLLLEVRDYLDLENGYQRDLWNQIQLAVHD